MSEVGFDRVVAEGCGLIERLRDLDPVAVGGTAVALHCGHRFSMDVDVVTPSLAGRFEETMDRLESWEAWRTNRRNPPVLILGERHGVELGVRQMRRVVPLRIRVGLGLRIPTASEMLRVKAFLLAERRMTRDWIDVAALAERLGREAAMRALRPFNLLYPSTGAQTWLTRFAEACESEPMDFALVSLDAYKGLRPPYTDWRHVSGQCQSLARQVLKEEMEDSLPKSLEGWSWEGEEIQ